MSIVIAAPYGRLNPEIGLQYLLARYLSVQGRSVAQLACNGVFGSCDRDAESNWRRPMNACFSCMQEQRDHAKWSDIPALRLSKYLSPDDIQDTARWVNGLSEEELLYASAGGVEIFPLLRGTFANRFGVSDADINNKLHERFLRSLVLSTVRLIRAGEEFARKARPELLILPFGQNFIYETLVRAAATQQVPCIILEANISKRCIAMRRAGTEELHECPLLIEEVLTLRNDVNSWSSELVRLLKEVEAFLGLTAIPAAVSGAS